MTLYLLFFLAAIALFLIIKFLIRKKEDALKGGDLVLLRSDYVKEYPNLPKDYPMHIEKLEDDYAVIMYMHSNNREICKTKVWLIALKKVS